MIIVLDVVLVKPTCPEVFEINDDGYATTIVDEVSEELTEDAIDAKEGCPVNAIEEVSDSSIEA